MTVSECVKSTKPYFTLAAWKHNHPNIHSKAKREGWLDTCIDAIQTPECWDKDTCIEDAKQFKTIYAWRHGNPDAFSHAQVQEWFEECTFHFADQSMVERTWSKCDVCAQPVGLNHLRTGASLNTQLIMLPYSTIGLKTVRSTSHHMKESSFTGHLNAALKMQKSTTYLKIGEKMDAVHTNLHADTNG
jgi:hypothetical protein